MESEYNDLTLSYLYKFFNSDGPLILKYGYVTYFFEKDNFNTYKYLQQVHYNSNVSLELENNLLPEKKPLTELKLHFETLIKNGYREDNEILVTEYIKSYNNKNKLELAYVSHILTFNRIDDHSYEYSEYCCDEDYSEIEKQQNDSKTMGDHVRKLVYDGYRIIYH